MKYREIQVMQLGGGVFFSAVADPAAQTAQLQPSSSGSSKENKLISDSVLNELFQKAMPNDVRKFTKMLAEFEQQVDMGLPVNKRALYDLLAYANQIIKQSDYMDKAEKQAVENGAWDEVAIDNRGNIYAVDEKGRLSTVKVSDYNPEKYQALSIGELIQMRKENDQLVDRLDIITTIGNAIGTEKINDYIQNIIKTVGQNETTSEAYKDLSSIIGGMAKRPTMSELQTLLGLSSQIENIGMDAIFKVTEGLSSKNIQDAFKYIIGMLPKNMRMQLQGKYVAELGGKYEDSGNYAQSLVMTALGAANDTKYTSKINYEGQVNTAAGTSSGKATGQLNRNLTWTEQMIQGSLGKTEYQLVSQNSPEVSMNLQGTGSGYMADANNNKLSAQPASLALDAGLGAMVDYDHIYAGDQKISQAMLDQFVYNGREVVNVWMPTDGRGNINWGLASLYQALLEKFKNNPLLTDTDKQEALQALGINGTFDDNGNFVGQDPNMERFIVFTGITSDQVLDEDENSYVNVMDKQDKDYWFKMIDRIYGAINKGVKSKDAQIRFKKDWTEWGTDLMSVPIFLRVGRTARFDAGTISDHGALVLTKTYPELLAMDQAKLIYKPSTSLLSNE